MSHNAQVRRRRKAQAKAERASMVVGPFFKQGRQVIGRAPGVAKKARASHRADLARHRAEKVGTVREPARAA